MCLPVTTPAMGEVIRVLSRTSAARPGRPGPGHVLLGAPGRSRHVQGVLACSKSLWEMIPAWWLSRARWKSLRFWSRLATAKPGPGCWPSGWPPGTGGGRDWIGSISSSRAPVRTGSLLHHHPGDLAMVLAVMSTWSPPGPCRWRSPCLDVLPGGESHLDREALIPPVIDHSRGPRATSTPPTIHPFFQVIHQSPRPPALEQPRADRSRPSNHGNPAYPGNALLPAYQEH